MGSPDHVKAIVNSSRTGVPLTPLRHVPAAIPLRLENQYFSLDVSHPWRRKCCRAAPVCFTSRGCSVSLNLNFLRYYERE
ncbi:type VI secretion system baseplate subunit TssK [Klebsiella pneumoniae subsp. pneumoniae]|nr:type VI secretion system baseplate subunit TssK [Klebsiella pneumoniae subsp. pneumoniae]